MAKKDNGGKLTTRLDSELSNKIDKIVEERKRIDPSFDKSKLVRELIQNYETPDVKSLIGVITRYAIHYGIPLNELKGAIGTSYRVQEQSKDPKSD